MIKFPDWNRECQATEQKQGTIPLIFQEFLTCGNPALNTFEWKHQSGFSKHSSPHRTTPTGSTGRVTKHQPVFLMKGHKLTACSMGFTGGQHSQPTSSDPITNPRFSPRHLFTPPGPDTRGGAATLAPDELGRQGHGEKLQ